MRQAKEAKGTELPPRSVPTDKQELKIFLLLFPKNLPELKEIQIQFEAPKGSVKEKETALQNFRLGTRECAVTDENRAFYGFDQPLCTVRVEQAAGTFSGIDENGTLVTYTIPAQSLRFAIGRAEGEYFYTCEYEGECYFISRFLAEMLVNASAEAMASRNPADWGDLALTKVQMQTEKGTAELRAV